MNETRRQLAAMRDVAQAVGTNVELSTLLPAIIHSVCQLVDSDRASLFLVDEHTGEVWSRVQLGHEEEIRLPKGAGIAGAVVMARCPVRLDDAWSDARFHRDIDEATGYRTTSLLAVPIVDKDGVVKGVVEALNKKGPPGIGSGFTDDDERLLMALGSEIAVALQRALLFDELARQKTALARRVSELDLLVDVDEALLHADGVQGVLDVVVDRARVLLPSDAASVALIDERTSALVFRAAAGTGQDKVMKRAIPSDTGLAGVALAERRPVRVADASGDQRHALQVSKVTTLVPGPLIAYPLLPTKDPEARPFGVLTVLRQQGSHPFTDDDERILGLIAARVVQCLADEERKEKSRTKQQLETIGHMLSGIVHDFKTPMTVISGYVQLLAVEDDAAERERSADVVLKSCEQMTTMIKELLSFARGDSTVLLRKVWLESFTADLEETTRRMIDKGGPITLIVDGQTRSAARLDDLKMKRALVNLVKNAREALGEQKGTIRVEIKDEGEDVVFVVADDGPGLAPEIESRLFDSFATFGKEGGTGLGLALVKRIAEEHHGGVVVDSAPGQGCKFTIRIPRS
ncbi:MAG: GAF domain-containing sensor histidine kinase [Deltaproteobacteria bacterium]|nr:GAF domain-containing sensor histidine kinase [Deltaproteobacteria bacterium]